MFLLMKKRLFLKKNSGLLPPFEADYISIIKN